MRRKRAFSSLCLPGLLAGLLPGLLAGCTQETGVRVPATCPQGLVLVQQDGAWRCGPLPAALALPTLDPAQRCDLAGYVLTSDGKSLSCIAVDRELPERIKATAASVEALEAMVAKVTPTPAAALGLYRGVTTTPSAGAITATGLDPGLAAAAARCHAEFGGSHLCSMPELYSSVIAGRLDDAKRMPAAWIYFPAGNAPAGATTTTAGIADTCAGYTYDKDDRGYSGIAAEWTDLPTGGVGFKFYGGAAAPCSASRPLACCGGAP